MITETASTTQSQKTVDALWRLQKIIIDTLDFNQVVERIVNSILIELGYLELGYRILVLTLVNPTTQTLQRIALSQTPEASHSLAASPIPFAQIEIPLTATDNFLIKALLEKKPYITHSWPDIFRPVLTDAEALHNQHAAGITTSMLYPLIVKGEAMGVMIFSMVKGAEAVTPEEKDLIARFTDIVGLAVQTSLLYSASEKTSQELTRANNRLQELDKLKDEFVSLASHELRTPMTAIKSYTWLLLQQGSDLGPLNEKQQEYVKNTFLSTERLIKLVNDMLNVSRIEAGRLIIDMHPENVEQLAHDILTEVLPTAQQHLRLSLTPPLSPLPQVLADPDKIKEVIMNLVGNSLKFTPPGGAITISFSEKDDKVVINVSDTGKGIKPEDVPKLFQKFGIIEGNYLKTTVGQGTGLGLYLAKSIIELHGGSIWFASDGENKGATFSFSLRVAK